MIGSVVLINITKALISTEQFQESDDNTTCKQTCFAMTTDYEHKIMVMEENEETLNRKINALNTDIKLNAVKYDSLQTTANDLAKKNKTLLEIVNRAHAMSK